MFADNLMELRKYHALSQEELAEKIGVSRQTLSKYETGESLPDIEKRKALADVFGITVDDLICYDNLIVLGDEGQGIALKKEENLLGLLHMAENGK